jgi:hypothetical protein
VQQQPVQTVYVLDQHGQPEAVQIKTGISDTNHVEAAGGNLVEGQEVITGMAAKSGVSGSPSQGSTKRLGF